MGEEGTVGAALAVAVAASRGSAAGVASGCGRMILEPDSTVFQ